MPVLILADAIKISTLSIWATLNLSMAQTLLGRKSAVTNTDDIVAGLDVLNDIMPMIRTKSALPDKAAGTLSRGRLRYE